MNSLPLSVQVVVGFKVKEFPSSSCRLSKLMNSPPLSVQSKKISNDQELIQSDPISCPQNQVVLISSSQSLNLGGRRGTTDDVATIPFQPSLSFAALRESPNPIPVYSLMLSSHLFFCLTLLLAPFTIHCRIVFAMPEDLEMWPYHLSFLFFTIVRRSSCTPVAFWILLRTSLFVTWSL